MWSNQHSRKCRQLGLFAAFGIALLAGVSRADDALKPINQYVHNIWRTEEGLPQNSVHVILQTKDGYLWMGTEEGLVRFNGVQFTVFDKTNTRAFKHNDVRSLMEDRDGNLWIGTSGGGALEYYEGKFRAFTQKEGLANNFVNSFLQDRNGNIWIASNNGVDQFKNGKFTRISKANGLSDDGVNTLAEDRNGDIWVGTNQGLNQVLQGRFDPAHIRISLKQDVIRTIYVDRSGVVWIGADLLGLYSYAPGQLIHYGFAQQLPRSPVLSLMQDDHGSLWVGTGGGGICRLDNPHTPARFACYNSSQGLSGDSVLSLFEDREKNVWAGTETGGINRFKDGSVTTYSAADGFAGAVRSIYEGHDGSIWAALDSGLLRWHNGHVVPYRTANGPANNYAWTVMEDRNGRIWAGTNEGGLNVFTGHQVKTYTTRDGLADNQVHAVLEDHAGNIWIGTERGGVSLFADGKFKTYTTRDGLANNRVWTIFEDHAHNLWFGTDGGLSRFEQGRFTSVDLHDDPNSGLATGGVVYIYEDQQHVLWIGTYGMGLKRLADGHLTIYDRRNGLFDDNVWAILDDGQGAFWMSSNLGIFQVKKSELTAYAEGRIPKINSISYGTADGMLGAECNGGSQNPAWKTSKGRLLFACVRGIVAVMPEQLKSNPLPPSVVIEKALINGHDVLQETGATTIGRGDLEFDFAGLSYVAPAKVMFKYKLEDFDQDWVFAGPRRAAFYTNIPAGNYTFRVIASNNDGVWNDTGAELTFYIRPRFYQTAPFYCASGLGFLLLCAGAYRLRIRRLQRRQRELVRVVAERTRDLEQEIDERMRVEEELKATAVIVESSHDAIWSSGLDGVLLTWNEGAEKLFGYSAKEAINSHFSMLVPQERKAEIEPRQAMLHSGQRVPAFETTLIAKGGDLRYVSLTLSPIYRQGRVVAVSAIGRDIEARKRAEEALKKAKQAAEEATRAKSEFLANMSHEIRTPLNGIMGMLELVCDTNLNAEQQDLLEMAQTSADTLLVIINDILDFSKIEAGKLKLTSEVFDLHGVVAEAAKTVAVRACQKRLELACGIAPDVPQRVVGDCHRLKQVLINLLGNAIKFTEAGEVVLRVQLEHCAGSQAVLKFSVSDTGIGISAAQQRSIFAPFEQADASTTRRFGGTGLGLTISSRIVSMMGGSLAVASNIGEGSTFHFTVTLVVAEQAQPQQAMFHGISALIVDDSKVSRDILKEMTEHWGITAVTAPSAAGAIEELRRAVVQGTPFHLLLLDYRMEEGDGITVAECMLQNPKLHVPAIALLTSDDYQVAAQRCRDFGITDHLIKPVGMKEVSAVISKALKFSQPEQRARLTSIPTVETNRRQNLSVLLAEDNVINQRLACRLLEKMGHIVTVACNGKEALARCGQQRFDVILMDVQMPEMDGFAATRAIRQRGTQAGLHCPIVAMTAHAMQGDKEACLAAGMDSYISKPITMEALSQVIRSVLEDLHGHHAGVEEAVPAVPVGDGR